MDNTITGFSRKISEMVDATEGGRYFLAESPGFKHPKYILEAAAKDGGVYMASFTQVLYEYLDDRVSL